MPNRKQASFYLCPSFKVFQIGIRRGRRKSHQQVASPDKKVDVLFPYNSRRTVYRSKDDVEHASKSASTDTKSTGAAVAAQAHGSLEQSHDHETEPWELEWWLGPGVKVFNDLTFPRAVSPVYLDQSALDASAGVSTVATDGSASGGAQSPSPPGGGAAEESQKMERSVSFTNIEVREYLRTLGDHPDAWGPPVSIDWTYTEMETLSVDEYESSRGPRRVLNQMRMHPNVRRRVLGEAGVGKEEMKATEKLMKKIQKQRSRTTAVEEVLPFVRDVEETVQSAKRKLKRRSWRSHNQDIKALCSNTAEGTEISNSIGLGRRRISPEMEQCPKSILISE